MKKTIYFIAFISSILTFSCTNKQSSNKIPKQEANNNSPLESKTEEIYDTLINLYGQSYIEFDSKRMDTLFSYNGQEYTLSIRLELQNDTVCFDEASYIKNGKIHIDRYTGRNIKYYYELKDKNGNRKWLKVRDKRYFMAELGSIVAQSNPLLPRYFSVFKPTNQIALLQNFWVPDTDIGVQGALYFSMNGSDQLTFNSWYGSSNSDCELSYNSDSSVILACTEFKNSQRKTISLKLDSLTIGGTMFLGDKYVFICYDDYEQNKRTHARIYSIDGRLIKEFKYQGLSGGLGYEIPFYFFEPLNTYYFVDESLECFHTITLNSNINVTNTPFRKVKKVIKEGSENKTIELSTEINNHLISINKSGEIVAHQIQVDEYERKFFDDLYK